MVYKRLESAPKRERVRNDESGKEVNAMIYTSFTTRRIACICRSEMGSVCSNASSVKADPMQIEKNKNIDKEIMAERKKKVLKLLLLGPGDSGKSTTLKQIRIIHDSGFSEEEKIQKKYIIYLNLISGVVELIRGLEEFRMGYQMSESYDLAQLVMKFYEEHKHNEVCDLSAEIADAISRFMMDPIVEKGLHRTQEISVDESAKYFLQHFDRIKDVSYVPSQDDILKSRVSTSGVVQFSFLIKNFVFKVFDVGGQKAQRRKWIHIFDDVHAVLFITSLSEYNQTLMEDGKTNRMRDSIELFDQICNNQWFTDTAMILFLNKIDLFEEKIKTFPITVALPRYKGAQEYRPSLDYITRKYKQMNRNEKRTVYTHETCATDTKQIQVVIDSVIDVVIQQTMQKVGIQ